MVEIMTDIHIFMDTNREIINLIFFLSGSGSLVWFLKTECTTTTIRGK